MHADELEIDDALVRALLLNQFPEWATLPLQRIRPDGTVHAIYRLGDELSLRLPRRERWSDDEHRTAQWLPSLASALPISIPVPIAEGVPGDGYPCHWSVCTWIDGTAGVDEPWDSLRAASDLAAFVAALRRVDTLGAPRGQDRLANRDAGMRSIVSQFGPEAVRAWEAALAAPPWDGAPVWNHADLDARNWLVRGGRIVGIIDWESFGAGDPAADVMVAWKLRAPEAVKAFRDALVVDEATWTRARGWAVAQAAAALAYYTPENNPTLVSEAERWLELALAPD